MFHKRKDKLFKDFPPVSTRQWEERIREDLKGGDYEKKLVWNTIEGIKVKPYYRLEDNEKLSHINTLPDEFPFVRGNFFRTNEWKIREDIEEKDAVKANKEAVNAIEKGAEAIGFNALSITDSTELNKMISGINLCKTPVSFIRAFDYKTLFGQFLDVLSEYNLPADDIEGSFNFDPLGYFILYGKFFKNKDDNFHDAAEIVKIGKKHLPVYRLINISGHQYHEAGASILQEVAFTLAHGNEYLAQLTDKNIDIKDITPRMQFTFSTGSSYFMEMAKIRAFRMLWANIVKQYHPGEEKYGRTYIHVLTSRRNKTIYDHYVNILRTTTEILSSAIGGADSISVNPFDITFKKPDGFSQRIARNQQLIIKHESFLNKVADPAGGSYYVEQLTDAIASRAWELFKDIERKGGFIKVAEKSFIKEEIEKTCRKRDMNISERKQVHVGTNQYPDLQEKMINKLHTPVRTLEMNGLKPYRAAGIFEKVRLATENHSRKGFNIPGVFLFTYGTPAMRKARAGFARNFFGCAGYDIIEKPGFDTIEKGVESALKSKAEIVVLCSSDEEYEEMTQAAGLIKEKNKKTTVIVAGYPKNIITQLQKAGVDDFIHVRSNVLEVLTRYNEKFEIKTKK